jgi:ABC-type uncharacterized transport system auxiliary subunit
MGSIRDNRKGMQESGHSTDDPQAHQVLTTSPAGVDDWLEFIDGDATPDISGGSYFKTANTGATTITYFDGFKPNIHKITVLFTDANTTIKHNSNFIHLQAETDFVGAVDDVKVFLWDGTNWVEQTVDEIGVLDTQHLRGNIWDPNGVQNDDNEICLWPETNTTITISKITVTLNAAANEVAGDLKWADTFIGLANATVINDFDTTNGVREDDSITAGAVSAGKCIYLSFDSTPNAAITQMCFDIEYTPAATKHLRGNIWNPNGVQGDDNEVCIWPEVDAAITISKITVTLNAAANEVAGDLKWADTFIGLANATVINDFDTTSGVREDDSITAGSVAAGKCIYLSFDSSPNSAITQMCFDIIYNYD